MKFIRSIFSLVLFLNLAVPAFAAEILNNQVLDKWFEAQKDIKTWNADFTQTRRLKTLTQPLTSTGHLWFSIPNQFRWEIKKPSNTIALKEGNTLYVIYPQLKRAENYTFDASTPAEWREALSMMEAGFPRDRAAMEAQFEVRSITQESNFWVLSLAPKSTFVKKMVTDIRLGLGTNDCLLKTTELVFIDGSSMRNEFSNEQKNQDLGPEIFHWTAPANYTVTKPFGK